MNMSTPAIEIRDLRVIYGKGKREVRALDGLNLTVPTGSVVGFLGPNGAGKTTSMHVLLGFVSPTSGEASVFGTDVRKSIARQRIGYLAEHPDTYRYLTGREILTMTGRLFLMSRAAIAARNEELLGMVGMADAADRRISTYSRGMMQRICLAQSLVNDPDLVILDEPTGGLDPIARLEVRKLISGLRARGKTVFLSSHELSEAELVCDYIAILSKGRIVAEGPSSKLVKPGMDLEKYFMSVIMSCEK